MKNIYPPIMNTSSAKLYASIFGQPQTDWLEEDIEHLPFAEVIFWSRRILSEPLQKESKYSMVVFQQKHPELVDKTKSITEQYKVYMEWKREQPPEGDLTTPFGHRVHKWFENSSVPQQFLVAYKTYGWYLIHKSKEIARKKRDGCLYTDTDWSHVIRCRQVFGDLDHAMYRMEMHNAGAWDLDMGIAREFKWLEMFWVFAQQENIDLSTLWSPYDKIQVRNGGVRYWWWESNYSLLTMPDDLEEHFENGRVSLHLDDAPFVTSV